MIGSTCAVYVSFRKRETNVLYSVEAKLPYDILMQFDEQKDQVAVEQILRVIFLDPERSSPVSGITNFVELFSFCNFMLVSFVFCITIERNVFFFVKALEKLKRQLAEAEAALEARKKPPEDTGPRVVGEGLVIDEWVML